MKKFFNYFKSIFTDSVKHKAYICGFCFGSASVWIPMFIMSLCQYQWHLY